MKISIIIPVGDETQWKTCEASLLASIAAAGNKAEAEILPCFDLEHRGAFAARNEGLDRATGEWIAWVDCDDVVEREWFGEIAAAIKAQPDVDVIQFDATEVKSGRGRGNRSTVERALRYHYTGTVEGERFAHELLRNDGMPAWLWTRAFRRTVFDGCRFEGRILEDYRMFLCVLPRIRAVWSVGKPLYRYIRHGHGLSNYLQEADFAAAGARFAALIEALPEAWRTDARIGLALTMADVARHSRAENGARRWVRKYLRPVLFDAKVPFRLKVKALLAACGRSRAPVVSEPAGEGAKRILHICAGWQPWNGAANIARMLADEQKSAGHVVDKKIWASIRELRAADEVWIHCGWLPCLWWAALWARKAVWVPECCYDPVRRAYHGWKKWLAGPFERFSLRRCSRIVATCAEEEKWIRAYLGKECPRVVLTDLRRFFALEAGWPKTSPRGTLGESAESPRSDFRSARLHVLYLGRRHPLKGVEYLERAVSTSHLDLDLRLVSDHFGEELERDWAWCDVLCLPTLSDNFGLVVAEALARGKRVITTDGAPAWEGQSGVVYLKGYRDGTAEQRVALLAEALGKSV